MIDDSVSKAKDAGVDFIVFGCMTLKDGRQRDYFINIVNRLYPEIPAHYDTIYASSKWGEPAKEYPVYINMIIESIAKKYRMLVRMPYILFKDLLSENDLAIVLLEHIDYLLRLQYFTFFDVFIACSFTSITLPTLIYCEVYLLTLDSIYFIMINEIEVVILRRNDMEFLELAKRRYSVRAYKSKPVEDDKLWKVLEAARLAPTACNLQPFQFIVIHTKGREAELRRIYSDSWFVEAPIIICACGIPSQSWSRRDGKNYCDIDVTISMDHLILAATDLGLGTCWIGAFNPKAAREILKLPDDVEPIAFTPLGYPDDKPRYKSRKNIDELVRYEIW